MQTLAIDVAPKHLPNGKPNPYTFMTAMKFSSSIPETRGDRNAFDLTRSAFENEIMRDETQPIFGG